MVVDLNDDDGRVPDELLAQSVDDDVVEDQRLVPRRTQCLRHHLNNARQLDNDTMTTSLFRTLAAA